MQSRMKSFWSAIRKPFRCYASEKTVKEDTLTGNGTVAQQKKPVQNNACDNTAAVGVQSQEKKKEVANQGSGMILDKFNTGESSSKAFSITEETSSFQFESASEESCYNANNNNDKQHFRLIKGGAVQIQPELNSEGQTCSQEQQDQSKNKKEERNYLTYTHKPTTYFASPRRPRLNLNIDINRDFVPALPYSELIGRGGFANVYKTTYKGFSVAVKQFHLEFQVKPHSDDFEKELSIIVQLDHKHLVKCYGACKIPNNRVIVMEFFGKSLYQRIQNFKNNSTHSRMGLVTILKILKYIASGLQYLHAKRIVHRDLHPQNVLIDDDGYVKRTDVGISKVLQHTISEDSGRGGCTSYLAPEIFDNIVCCQSDIYSVGIIAWQLWSLQEPWKDVGFGLVCNRVKNGERPLIPHDTPQDLKDIITTCWQQDYKQRPSALQLVQQCNEKLTPLLEQRRTN